MESINELVGKIKALIPEFLRRNVLKVLAKLRRWN